jgi:two-component sensor histidine kinase
MLLEKLTALLESGDTLSVEYRVIAGDGRTVWVLNRCNVIRNRTGPSRMTGVMIDITDRKVISDRRQRVMRELDHRVKNTLAVVSAIADRTNKPATTLSEFTFQLSSRVSALARIHTALSRHSWLGLTMEDLVSAACGDEPRMQIEGPSISIPLEIAQPLGMALCELVTNARTYGALSNETGRIAINWQVERLDAAGTLQIEWIEAGGPPVRASETRGCGLYLIEDVLRYEIDADVEMSFFEPGLRCTIAIPVPEP